MLPQNQTFSEALVDPDRPPLITTDLTPVRRNGLDQERYRSDVQHITKLVGDERIDGLISASLPAFGELQVRASTAVRKWIIKLKKKYPESRFRKDWETLYEILYEVRDRFSSHDIVEPSEELSDRHIRTLAGQNNSSDGIGDILHMGTMQNAVALFIVSGGHPYRKLIGHLQSRSGESQVVAALTKMLLHDVDSVSITRQARQQFGIEAPILGAWNYHTDQPDRIEEKTEAGMNGLISQPMGIMPHTFHDAVDGLRGTEHGELIRIQAGVAEIRTLSRLRAWFALLSIRAGTNEEVRTTLEAYERAAKDGHLEFFSDARTRNEIERALSMAGIDGVHFMPYAHDERSATILEQATGTGQYPTGLDASLHAKKRVLEIERQFSHLSYPVRIEFVTRALEDKKIKKGSDERFCDEFLDALETTHQTIRDLQVEHPDCPHVWNRFEIQFIRITQRNHAHTLPAEYITSSDGNISELRIDYRQSKGTLRETIRGEMLKFLAAATSDEEIFLDDPEETVPTLERAGDDGWHIFGPLMKAKPTKAKGDPGIETALKPKVVSNCAQTILESLLEAPDDLEEYVIMEFGCWNANGIPEMLSALDKLVEADDEKDSLRTKLKRTRLVGVDIAREGVDSFTGKMGTSFDHLLGLGIEGVECDVRDEEAFNRLMAKYKEKVIFSRTINTPDALRSQLYTTRGGKTYRVPYRTSILRNDIEQAITGAIEYFDGVEKDRTITVSLNTDDILEGLAGCRLSKGNEARYFLEKMERKGVSKNVSLLLWERIINAMKKRHYYQETSSELPEDVLAQKVGAMHPDNRSYFASSYLANHFASSIAGLLHPTGRATFFQLTKDLGENNAVGREPSVFGVTPCRPIQKEAFFTNGFRATFTPGPELGLRPSSSMMTLQQKTTD